MTEAKEVEESSKALPEYVDEESVAKVDESGECHPTKEVNMSGENCKEEKEAVEEEEEGEGEEEEEEGEEEEDEEEEEEEVEDGEEDEELAEEDEGEEEDTEESEEDEVDDEEQKVQPKSAGVSDDGASELHAEASPAKNYDEKMDSPMNAAENNNDACTGNVVSNLDGVMSSEVHEAKACESTHADSPIPEAPLESNMKTDQPSVNDENGLLRPEIEPENGGKLDAHDSANSKDVDGKIVLESRNLGLAPSGGSSILKEEQIKEEELKCELNMKERTMDDENKNLDSVCIFDTDTSGGGESGTGDEQAAFMNELEKFHKEKSLEFKPPKFYGEPLNLLKLWRAVMKLGGYDKVTACKYWRQVGESFKPPKTCTTVSWTFRIFYEKALLEYERYRTSGHGPSVPTSLPAPMSIENPASGSGRARRDAAARAMQGWHSQRILDNGEVSDPIIKDKNLNSLNKKEKQLKNLGGVLKRKKPPSTDGAVNAARTKPQKTQSETTVIDIGSPADWVKINVRETKDCYEVYALVPGLLREEVRVQSDPAGRLVISGEPENPDNPWNVTPFKKVVSLPSRIDPHQTSAVVTLHGQLFVRVPFEQYD